MQTYLTVLSFITPITLIIGLVIGWAQFNKYQPLYKILFWYLCVALVTDLLCRYFGYVDQGKFNLFMIPLFAFAELVLFAYLYYQHFLDKPKLMLWVLVVPISLAIVDFRLVNGSTDAHQYQSYGMVIADFTIILCSLAYFWKTIQASKNPPELFALNSAFLIFFSFNMLLFSALNFLVNEHINLVAFFWIANNVSLVAFYSFIIYQLWQHGKTLKTLQYG
ncbi:MAG: hypothetical protein ACPGJS_08950 [Flammeovirgaceae bacterium]